MDPAVVLDLLVSDVLGTNPGAARVFIGRRMECVGCAFAPFETVADVARVYGMNPRELASALAAAGAAPPGPED